MRMARKLVISVVAALAIATASASAVAAQVGAAGSASSASRASAASPTAAIPTCSPGYYKNRDGRCVRRPSRDPVGATAKCWDGTYSYSLHASGTCSHHGGVMRWIHHP
jgi:hypothetical protein